VASVKSVVTRLAMSDVTNTPATIDAGPRRTKWAWWLLSALPGVAIAGALGWYFKALVPVGDGAIFFNAARNAWNFPLKAENFWSEWLHKGSYVSMGLLGLAYHVGPDAVTAVRALQFGVFVVAILAFASICRSLFRDMSGWEATLLTTVFSITPASRRIRHLHMNLRSVDRFSRIRGRDRDRVRARGRVGSFHWRWVRWGG
jgi:hypothetical protein